MVVGDLATASIKQVFVVGALLTGTHAFDADIRTQTIETIWSKETGLDRSPADLVEVRRPHDSRERYLSEAELGRLMEAL